MTQQQFKYKQRATQARSNDKGDVGNDDNNNTITNNDKPQYAFLRVTQILQIAGVRRRAAIKHASSSRMRFGPAVQPGCRAGGLLLP